MTVNKTRLKFVGSLALVLSTAGVLFAVGGQLNFLGNKRPHITVTKTSTPKSDKPPKYSFYNDLKRRKTEIENGQVRTVTGTASTSQQDETASSTKSYRYVVQVGAFSNDQDAGKVKRQVEGLGYPARVVKGGSKYLTQAGPFKGKKKAVTIEKHLKSKKFPTLIKRLN